MTIANLHNVCRQHTQCVRIFWLASPGLQWRFSTDISTPIARDFFNGAADFSLLKNTKNITQDC